MGRTRNAAKNSTIHRTGSPSIMKNIQPKMKKMPRLRKLDLNHLKYIQFKGFIRFFHLERIHVLMLLAIFISTSFLHHFGICVYKLIFSERLFFFLNLAPPPLIINSFEGSLVRKSHNSGHLSCDSFEELWSSASLVSVCFCLPSPVACLTP